MPDNFGLIRPGTVTSSASPRARMVGGRAADGPGRPLRPWAKAACEPPSSIARQPGRGPRKVAGLRVGGSDLGEQLERVTRIELALSAWEAAVHPDGGWRVSARQRHDRGRRRVGSGLGVPHPCHIGSAKKRTCQREHRPMLVLCRPPSIRTRRGSRPFPLTRRSGVPSLFRRPNAWFSRMCRTATGRRSRRR